MKKVVIFLVIIIGIFAALAFVTNYSNQQASEGNPFGKSKLHSSTIGQLDDPYYQNQILPEELDEKLANNEDLTVYFYSPECSFCRETSPIIVPMTQELGLELPLFNLLEFKDGWRDYGIESTPTVVRYEDGKEVSRIEGKVSDTEFQRWFEQWVE